MFSRLKSKKIEFEQIVNTIPQLAWMTDETGHIYWFNKRWYDYTGTTLEEMQGWGWQKVHHPDHVGRVVNVIEECFLNGEDWEDTFPLRAKDGTYRWFLSRARALHDEDNTLVGWFGTNTDITEQLEDKDALVKSENRLRNLIDNMTAFVAELDIDGVLKEVNQSALDVAGLSREDVIGKKFWDCYWWSYDQEVIERLKKSFEKCLQGKIVQYDETVRIANDNRLHIAFKMAPAFDENGEVVRIIPSGFDITERKKAEEKLSIDNERKNRFIAILSHELRNPLSPITNILSLLSKGLLKEEKRQVMIDTALKSAHHLARLIDDLLDITRIQRGKIELHLNQIDLVPIIQEAVAENEGKITAKNHTVNIHCPFETLIVKGDAGRLRQAISNVMGNAVKYCPNDSVIDLTCEQTSHMIEITVSDNGPGIPEEMLADVFEMFVQVDEALNRNEEGLGIGLSLVKELIQMHDGTVFAKNRKGGGLQVTIILPVSTC